MSIIWLTNISQLPSWFAKAAWIRLPATHSKSSALPPKSDQEEVPNGQEIDTDRAQDHEKGHQVHHCEHAQYEFEGNKFLVE